MRLAVAAPMKASGIDGDLKKWVLDNKFWLLIYIVTGT
jgi:hypothetical protein